MFYNETDALWMWAPWCGLRKHILETRTLHTDHFLSSFSGEFACKLRCINFYQRTEQPGFNWHLLPLPSFNKRDSPKEKKGTRKIKAKNRDINPGWWLKIRSSVVGTGIKNKLLYLNESTYFDSDPLINKQTYNVILYSQKLKNWNINQQIFKPKK